MKINIKQLTVVVIISTLSILLFVNNNEYRKYKALDKQDITTLSGNVVSAGNKKTQIDASLQETIVNLQLEQTKLKTTMENRLQGLKSENESLKAALGIKKIAYLRPHDGIDSLSLQYGTKAQPSVGYMGTIKTLDFDEKDFNEVKVLETKDDWAKISIEAYIPKWYLVDTQDGEFKKEDIIHTIQDQKMFTKGQGPLKLAPDKNSFTQLSLEKGKAVFVTKEFQDWYFIKLQQTHNETDFTEGWVKKSQLGMISEVVPLEAIIKKGTLIMEYYDTNEKEKRILEEDVPVYLIPEKNIGNFIYGKVTDSSGFWINKKDVDFNYNLRK